MGVKMAPDNEKLLCHVASLACVTHASRVAHLAVEHKSSTLVFLCGSGMDRKKRERKHEQLLLGGGAELLQSTTQTDHSGKNASLMLVC